FSYISPSAADTTGSPTHGKSSFKDASQLLDNPDMLAMEDITYSDHENVGAEANFNNLETSITVSPIPTTRTHKDHHVSQIIEFEDHSDNSSNDVNADGSIVPTAGQNSSNNTNPFGAADTTGSPTHGKSSFKDASQLLDNP
nr:hypothetical protein [Tanacetum cinerariifolium]